MRYGSHTFLFIKLLTDKEYLYPDEALNWDSGKEFLVHWAFGHVFINYNIYMALIYMQGLSVPPSDAMGPVRIIIKLCEKC